MSVDGFLYETHCSCNIVWFLVDRIQVYLHSGHKTFPFDITAEFLHLLMDLKSISILAGCIHCTNGPYICSTKKYHLCGQKCYSWISSKSPLAHLEDVLQAWILNRVYHFVRDLVFAHPWKGYCHCSNLKIFWNG